MMIFRRMTLAALAAIMIPALAQAASDVSNSSGAANVATATAVGAIASTQTATIISGAATGGFTFGGGAGGFSGGGTGGFTGGGTGGFSSGGTGGSGGFNTGTGGSGGFGSSGNPDLKPQSYTPGTGSGRVTSQSIGDAGVSNGLWGQALYAHINKTETGLEMRGNVYNGLVGFDHRFMNDYLVGVSTGYEYVDIDTRFNHGSYKSDGISLVPYAAITLTPNWTWDAGAGYTWLNYHSTSQYDTVKSDYDGGRWIGTTSMTGSYAWENWRAQLKTSLLYSREHQNSYYDTSHSWNDAATLSLGRLSTGGKFGYAVGDFLPYVKVMAEWDFLRPGAVVKGNNQLSHVDDGGGVAGLGLEYNANGVTSSLEVDNNSVMRKDMDVWAVIARLRWEW